MVNVRAKIYDEGRTVVLDGVSQIILSARHADRPHIRVFYATAKIFETPLIIKDDDIETGLVVEVVEAGDG